MATEVPEFGVPVEEDVPEFGVPVEEAVQPTVESPPVEVDGVPEFGTMPEIPDVPLEQHPFVVNTLSDPLLNDEQRQSLIERYGETYSSQLGADTDAIDSFKLNFRNAWDNYNTVGATLRRKNLGQPIMVEEVAADAAQAQTQQLQKEELAARESGDKKELGILRRLIGSLAQTSVMGSPTIGDARAKKTDTLQQDVDAREALMREEKALQQQTRYVGLLEEARKQGEFAALDSEGFLENVAAFSGSLGGALVDPANAVPLAKPVQGAGIVTRLATAGAQAAAINAAINPLLQAGAVDANQQEGFEWGQFFADAGLGGVAGVGFQGLGEGAQTLLKRFKVDAAKVEGKTTAEALDTIAKESGESAENVAKAFEVEVSNPELKKTLNRLAEEPGTQTAAAEAIPEGQKQRGFSERLKGDENFDAAEIAANPKEYYDPQSNVKGEAVVAAMDDTTLERTFNNMNPDAPSGQNWSTLAGIERLRRAVARGEDTKPIREALSQRGTSLGQAIQQYASWKSATPEGVVAVLEDTANANGRRLTDEMRQRGMKLAQDRLEAQERLRQAEARHLDEFTDESKKAYDAAYRDAADTARGLDQFSRDMTPPEFWRNMSTVIKGNLLTSESLLINVLGNALYYPVRKAKGVVANVLDGMWSLASKERTHAEGVAKTRGELVGAAEGLQRGMQALRYGGTMDDYLKAEVQHGFRPVRALLQAFAPSEKGLMPVKESTGKVALSDRGKKLMEGLLGGPPEAMFRLLQLGDQPFRGSAYRGAVEELAALKQLKGVDRAKFMFQPDEASRALAMERGNAAVFMKDGPVGKYLRTIDEAIGRIPVIGKPSQFLGTLIVPYRQFPVNFIMEAADYAIPALSMGKSLYQASQGNQREATELMAKALTGISLYSASAYLYEKGIVTPNVDFRDRKLKDLSYNFKQPPGTVNLSGIDRLMKGQDPTYQEGDRVMGYEKLGIPGIAMHLESKMRFGREKEQAEGKLVPDPAWWERALPVRDLPETAGYLAEATPLLGTASAISALLDWENRGERFMRDMFNATTSAVVPNSVTAAMKTQYEHIPELKGRNMAETFRNVWTYKTHLNGAELPTKVGLLGEKVERTPKGSNPWVYHLANPVDLRRPENKPIYTMIEELYRKTGDTAVIPGQPAREFTDPRDGKSYKLDAQNYQLLQEHVGKARRELLRELMREPWRKWSTEEALVITRKVYSMGRKIGVDEFINDPATDLKKAEKEALPVGFLERTMPKAPELEAIESLQTTEEKEAAMQVMGQD